MTNRHIMRKRIKYAALGTAIAGSFLPLAPLHAQTDNAVDAQDIIITGSRVITNGNDSPTPVTVVSVQQMEAVKPGTVADQLNELPQFFGSQTQSTRAGAGTTNEGNPNAQGNVLNLRNFGIQRNLILFDGHRVAPNSANGTIDIDLIPQFLLQRVDVVTGGASAVYGSDAVTGVVNFITDTKFTGLKVNGQAGISQYGDGGQQALGAGWGVNLGDRGHFMASYEYRNDEGIDARSERQWGRNRYLFTTLSNVNGLLTTSLDSNTTRQDASFGGTITTVGTSTQPGVTANPFANQYFSGAGVLSPVTATKFIAPRTGVNGTGSYFDPSLKGSLRMHQFFGRFDYDLGDSLHFWLKGAGSLTKNGGYAISNPTYQASNGSNIHSVFVSNPLLPGNIAAAMTNAGYTSFGINKVHGGPTMQQYRQFTEVFGKNISIDGGFSGDLGNGWKWETAVIYSRNKQRSRQNNAMNGLKLAAALDAVTPAGGGAPVCWVSTQPAFASKYQGCVPYNIFGPSITQAEADWIFDPLEVTTTNTMIDAEAFVSGSPFSSWAGPVQVALSGQARRQSYQVDSSTNPASPTNPLDCSGLRLISCNAFSLAYFQAESLSRPKVSVNVKEIALEANVPLLRDVTLFRDLSLNGAYRFTDYSTSGSVSTWKVGLDWKVTDELTFRGTRSRDIRAPSLHELYQPASVGSFNGRDELLGVVLDGAAGRPNPAGVTASGNPNLMPEKGDTTTIGAVYKPQWLPGFSAAIDYYSIKLKDGIIYLRGQDAATQVDCINSKGTSITCTLIQRAVDCCTASINNPILRGFNRAINIATLSTKGVDIELNYVNRLFNNPFNLRLLISHQPKNVQVDALSGISTNYAGSANYHPKWRGTLLASFAPVEDLRISIQERWRGRMNWFPVQTGPGATKYAIVNGPSHISERFYTNLNLAWQFRERSEFYVNVQNLFNQKPAIFADPFNSPFAGLNSVAPGDDPVGRYFTAGFRLRL